MYFAVEVGIVLGAFQGILILSIVWEVCGTIKKGDILGVEFFVMLAKYKVAVLRKEEGVLVPLRLRVSFPVQIHIDRQLRACWTEHWTDPSGSLSATSSPKRRSV